ncbi:DUF2149 domain-containing protein [Bacilliculturomica massiliensis]|uniref:DUF2149 domain-containing protein n=1 Tax=Bacilliculturomica massiliensis TaxID=1917867 RepID=UPI001FED2033|nr:DUF2149 domain-containing protein [Bacilliculturomica massiliensis]
MLRSRGLGGRKKDRFGGGEVSPMENLANLVDVMLVFACGLMIAVILHWNVDLSKVMDVVTEEDLVEVEDLEKAIQDGSLMEDLDSKGFVYQDPETGKMYIISK